MIITSDPISMNAAASVSATSAISYLTIKDTSVPTVTAETYDASMFDWVVEPAGPGPQSTISLL